MIEVSVVVPNKGSPTVGLTLESLEHQSYARGQYEVIVVGTDAPGGVRESDLVKFERSPQPLSPAAARNRGAKLAQGEVLAFIDADCSADRNWLCNLMRPFADPAVDVVGGGVEIEGGGYWATADNLSLFHDSLARLAWGTRQQLPSLNLAVRRRVFMAAGGFNEGMLMGEDADLTVRLRRDGSRLFFQPRAIVIHASPRMTPTAVFQRGLLQGYHSIKVHPAHRGTAVELPKVLRDSTRLLLCSPLVALGATLRTFASARAPVRWWPLAPAIYVAKLGWCIGASRRLEQERGARSVG